MEEVPLTPAPGGGAQEFRLQWKNFSTNLATSLDIFKNEKDFVDVTLVCEGQQLLAHRMLLCACSPYFRNIIKANPCPHPIIILSNEVKYTDLEKLLDFMYQGSVNVVQEHLARFLKTAEMLKIRGLADDDKKSMQPVQHPSSPCVSNSGTITPNDCGSSPKRPRLSLENNASNPCTSTSSTLNNSSSTNNSYSNNTTPPTTLASSVNLDTPNTPSNIEESTHSANDSDSEMLPVKQEMVELKSCDEFETDADHFIPEAYLKDGVGLSEGAVQGIGQGPPPPPGALRPSYVPPPPIKAQEDSAPNNTGADELSQDVLFRLEGLAASQINTHRRLDQPPPPSSDGNNTDITSNSNLLDSQLELLENLHNIQSRNNSSHQQSESVGMKSCPVCGKMVQLTYLSLHMKRVHGSLEAKCSLCGRTFKNKHSLGVHLARYHPKLGLNQQRIYSSDPQSSGIQQQNLHESLFTNPNNFQNLLGISELNENFWLTATSTNNSAQDQKNITQVVDSSSNNLFVDGENGVVDTTGHLEIDLT